MVSRTSKFRGSRTHGRGFKAGRGKGLRGGKGMAGGLLHNFLRTYKADPNRFGRHGFKRPQSVVRSNEVMNVARMEEQIDALVRSGIARKKGNTYEVNLEKYGIDKLLGTGNVRNSYRVTVKEASKVAIAKIEGAGGSVKTLAKK